MEAVARITRCYWCRRHARVNGFCQDHQLVAREMASLRASITRQQARLANGALTPPDRRAREDFITSCEGRLAVLQADVDAVRAHCRALAAGED